MYNMFAMRGTLIWSQTQIVFRHIGEKKNPFFREEKKRLYNVIRDDNWTQVRWTPAKNTHDGRVNTCIAGYGHGYG